MDLAGIEPATSSMPFLISVADNATQPHLTGAWSKCRGGIRYTLWFLEGRWLQVDSYVWMEPYQAAVLELDCEKFPGAKKST